MCQWLDVAVTLFGTHVVETILASVHVGAHQQAGHMNASDLIKIVKEFLRGGGRLHMAYRFRQEGLPIPSSTPLYIFRKWSCGRGMNWDFQ